MRGFSLVELLVVLLIAGLLAGTVSLSLGAVLGGGPGVHSDAGKLSETLRLTQELAVISGQPAGLLMGPADGDEDEWYYSIMQYRSGDWQPWSPADAGIRDAEGRLRAGTRLSLELDGEAVSRERILSLEERGDPLLVLLPTGELPRFVLRLANEGGEPAVLRVTARGELEVPGSQPQRGGRP
ncbi:MAG: GspH/FimT family pseudopilin [Pseudohongiellaceae bacterium]